jgi:antitoxin PrlF
VAGVREVAQLSKAVRIAANGRMVLPVGIRRALGIEGETRLVVTVDEGVAKIESVAARVKRAQELYRLHAKNPRTVDEFLADRKRENARRDEVLSPYKEA